MLLWKREQVEGAAEWGQEFKAKVGGTPILFRNVSRERG
jgi:hypothetical protein